MEEYAECKNIIQAMLTRAITSRLALGGNAHGQTIIADPHRGSEKAQTPSCMNRVTHGGARMSRMDRKNFFIVRLNSKISRLRGPMLIHARQGCTGKVDSQLPFLCLCAMHGSALQGAPTEIRLS